VTGAILIYLDEVFIGFPALFVIIATGGVSPVAIAAEAIELLVWLPINLFGFYLIIDATQR